MAQEKPIPPYYDHVVSERDADAIVQGRGERVEASATHSVWRLPHDTWARLDAVAQGVRVRLYEVEEGGRCPCGGG